MNKIMRGLLLPGIMLMLLTSCSTKETTHFNYTFKGEADTWAAVYDQQASKTLIIIKDRVKGSESSKRYTFQLHYKGEQADLGKIKQLKYSYEGASGSGSLTMEGPVPVEQLKMGGISSGNIESEDSVIKVYVDWDGKSEQFELKMEK